MADYERQVLVSFPGRDSEHRSVINPRDPTNDLGNSVSPTTFNIEKSENILEQKQKQNKTKNSVRNIWRITVLFGTLTDRTLSTKKYQQPRPGNASRHG